MKNKIFIFLILIHLHSVFSQVLKDTLHLEEVNVSASIFETKNNTFSSGKKVQYIDSILKQIYDVNNLSSLLNYQSSVFVKNYAPGSISSTSVRGGNAQQTMLLWNGININHPMLGQADLSQCSAALFDNISIEYGAASSLWGSPAMNGAIRLESKFSKDNSFGFKYRYGSFNTHLFSGKIKSSYKKIGFYIRPYYQSSANDYSIGDSIQVKNASFRNLSAAGGVQFYLNKYSHLQIHSWINSNNRNIPNNYFFNKYAARQKDRSFRNMVDYLYDKKIFQLGIKAAYILDELDYKDTLARINSFSKVHTFQTEENIYKDVFAGQMKWMIGHQWIYNYAITNNYMNDAVMNRHSVFTGVKQYLKKFQYNIIVRKEWANIKSGIPFTGNIGAEYQIFHFLSIKAQASKNYRLPTLNDLYWKGSGDISLKPESGYEYEGGMVLKFDLHSLHSQIVSEITIFNRHTDNWIIWLPGGNGNPVPANISKVWSRGAETNNYWLFIYKKLKVKTSVHSAYILSTVEQSKINNDASIGRQLIYTPRYNINGYLQIALKNYFLIFTHQYVGYRFISSDNLQWLEPYHISDLSFGKKFTVKNTDIQIIAGMQNLMNTSYTIVSQRPMPGRNYFIQINFQMHTKNQLK